MTIEVFRTPAERFSDLVGWPYETQYTEIDGLRLAHVEVGEGSPILLLHGLPSWGYLWRKVMPPLIEAGHRVIVPDIVGFGQSDKPSDKAWYSYESLYGTTSKHLDGLVGDHECTVVVHDWGGPLGLRWATEHREQVAHLVLLDTGLTGRRSATRDGFTEWVRSLDELPIATLMQGGTATELSPETIAAYEAPFDGPASQAACVTLPLLVSTSNDDPGTQALRAVAEALDSWSSPTLVLWGAEDPILPTKIGQRFAERIPGAGDCEVFSPAGHFLQEDVGEQVGARIAEWLAG